jgi:predicted aconitase with swiveling domain
MYKRLIAGKSRRVSASGYNAAMEAAEAYERTLRGQSVPSAATAAFNQTVVDVRNMLDSPLQRSYVVGLGDWLFDPDNDEHLNELAENICVQAVQPDITKHLDRFGVLPSDLVAGEVGPAVVGGLIVAQVQMVDAADLYCTLDDGNVGNLKSAAHGRGRILKVQTGTGVKWALIELGPARPAVLVGKADTAIAVGDTDKVVSEWDPHFMAPTGRKIRGVTNHSVDIGVNDEVSVAFVSHVPIAAKIKC